VIFCVECWPTCWLLFVVMFVQLIVTMGAVTIGVSCFKWSRYVAVPTIL